MQGGITAELSALVDQVLGKHSRMHLVANNWERKTDTRVLRKASKTLYATVYEVYSAEYETFHRAWEVLEGGKCKSTSTTLA